MSVLLQGGEIQRRSDFQPLDRLTECRFYIEIGIEGYEFTCAFNIQIDPDPDIDPDIDACIIFRLTARHDDA
jgi:hypothetical protein